jgi:hypothetical protein
LAFRFNRHLDSSAEPVDDRHEPIDGEATEIGVSNARKISRRYPCASLRLTGAQAFLVERPDYLRRKNRLELLNIRVLLPKVAEHASAAVNQLFVINLYPRISSVNTRYRKTLSYPA